MTDREAKRPGDVYNIIRDLVEGDTVWVNTQSTRTTMKGEVAFGSEEAVIPEYGPNSTRDDNIVFQYALIRSGREFGWILGFKLGNVGKAGYSYDRSSRDLDRIMTMAMKR